MRKILFYPLLFILFLSSAHSFAQTQTIGSTVGSTVTFTSDGDLIIPPVDLNGDGIVTMDITVEAWGAGGGTESAKNKRAGGGGGAYILATYTAVTGCTSFPIIVGQGGVGVDGGDTSFDFDGSGDKIVGGGEFGGTLSGKGGAVVGGPNGARGGEREGGPGDAGGGGGGSGIGRSGGGDGGAVTPGVGGLGGGGTSSGGAGGDTGGFGMDGTFPGGGAGGKGTTTNPGDPGAAGGHGQVIVTVDAVTTITCDPTIVCDGAGNLSHEEFDNATCACISVADPAFASGISNILCDDGGTPSDPSDDFITFELDPTDLNLGTTYTLNNINVTPAFGTYGSPTMFSTTAGTAGAGDILFEIEDDTDATCTFDETLTDPGTCSDDCLLEFANITNILCDDGGTPSDDTDDFITFELDPTGLNLGTTYTLNNISVTSPSGTYGSPTMFTTTAGTAGAGDILFEIQDDNDSACTFDETLTDPGTCSDACEITAANITNILCDDGGTPSDPSDDFITFELDPTGANLGTTYTLNNISVTSTTGTYGSPTMFSTTAGTAGAGDILFEIEDDNDTGCTLDETLTDPGTCSDACEITAANITNIQCNDGGTPSDPSDDYITFDLDPTGANLGTTYTLNNISVTSTSGTYGSPTMFSTTAGTAGAGDILFEIQDDNDTGCTLDETLTDPGTCSDACEITAANITNIQCNDGGTPSDPSDDFITFELDPTGANLGTTYTLNNISITSTSGTYGSPTMFSTTAGTAGAGDILFEIQDDNDTGCTFDETLTDPGTCSDACEITAANITNIQCNDGGTPSDPSDDFITFELDPTGANLGTTYTLNNISVTSTSGTYGSPTMFSTTAGTAGAGDILFEIQDDNDTGCTLDETLTDPGTCSDACEITAANITNIQCNDGGTPSDPSDDYITFDLDPTGANLGTTYTLNNISVTSTSGTYGSPTMFSTTAGTAGAGDILFEIQDDNDTGCTLDETLTDPGTCSDACEITAANITNIQCNDGGTPSDPSDDFITFELDPTGANLGTTYTLNNISITSTSGTYGSPTMFSTTAGTAGAGDILFEIQDDNNAACTFDETLTDPGTCSDACEITAANITNIQCNDGGTPSDPSDDYITFELDPTGANLGTTYTLNNISVTSTSGTYGSPTMFSTTAGTAGAGDILFEIQDDNDTGCTLDETLTDPGTCSDACEITAANITNIQCNDGGTPSDPSDDFITFELDPTGANLGTTYTLNNISITSTSGTYGSPTMFSTTAGTAGAGDILFEIQDDNNAACTFDETLTDPGTCSDACEITAANITNIQCNDGGTPSDPSDDYITFELDPTGANLGTTYTLNNISVTSTSGTYGSPTMFSTTAGTAGAGDILFEIQDDNDTGCTLDETLTDPGTCSDACEITAANITNIQCNDGGTPSDPSDDFITFELDPTGANLGTTYTLNNISVTSTSGTYGSPTMFSTTAGTAGAGDILFEIQDDNDTGCTLDETLTDPGTCSDACEITAANITNIQCNDGGTPSDPSDDFITFELDPTGANLGTTYTLNNISITSTSGTYGSPTMFSTTAGTAGAGDILFEIQDDNDTGCTLDETLTDPGTCSNTCLLNASGISNIVCNDGGTPSDPSDDYITFDLDPMGLNLGTAYTITGATVTPSGGNYGGVTSFSTAAGTAGAGNLNISIEDNTSSGCSLAETVADPGTCSNTCLLSASGISNIVCNDGGTPSDPSDDYITFDLDPMGLNVGTAYTITGATVTPSGGNYGASTSFSTAAGTAGAGNLSINIEDNTSSGCSLAETVTDPGTCSNTCLLSTSGITNIICNDGGTPSDPSDDYITFDLDPMGLNLGTAYTITGATVTPSGGNYGAATSFSTAGGTAGAGNLSISIEDNTSSGCSLAETVTDPGTCSNTCLLSASGISNIICNDGGTPSDPSDDYITFDLDPTGLNLGTAYTITGAAVTPSGGNYGAAMSFATAVGTAGAGNLSINIEDNTSSGCSLAETVTDPGTCSNTCLLSASGITNILCNDGGTPSDPSDDYITFDLDPMGLNLGTAYTITGATVTPSGGNYGGVTSFSTAAGTAGAGNLSINIEDNTSSGCSLAETVTDPGTCSNTCLLSASGISNIVCNDGGTPSDPSDDFITFDLNPMGLNLGTAYTITGATVTPSGGNYGGVTSFSTAAGTAGAGNLNINIEDNTSSGCSLAETVTDPGTCSNTCLLSTSGITNIMCNDGGTPSDPSDDYITFDLNPMGLNLGTAYTITGATVTPSGGNYGGVTSFSTAAGTAGAGNLNINIEDNTSSGCSLAETVTDPGTCSNTCLLSASGISNIMCNDGGTPSDPSDDFITFDLNPMGLNLGNGYTLVGVPVVGILGGTYGSVTTFSTQAGTAGMGNISFTIVDDNSGGCTFPETLIDPGTCSNACQLLTTGLTNITCNDNGTPSDATDDYITFDLNPMGLNLGTAYTITGATVTPSGGNYGGVTSFSTAAGTAGAGNLNINIEDNTSSGCSLAETVTDPGTCSNTCLLSASGISNIMCNDGGTPSDPSDDFITFDLNPMGLNLGNGYTLVGVPVVGILGGTYGSVTTFSTQAGTAGMGNISFTIVDDNSGGCTFPETLIDPGTCSNACQLLTTGLTNITCNDNGTPSDATDDFITFDLNPMGLNLGTAYTITGATVTPSGGNYGGVTSFSTAAGTAGAGNLNINIEDNTSSGCSLAETVTDPGTCSNTCLLNTSGISNIQCNDGGTPSDPSDDYITFDLDPMGLNLGTAYTITGATVTPSGGNYGAATSFATAAGTAGAGNLSISIEDNTSSGCSLAETVTDPGTCSNTCLLSTSGISNIVCNDGGTPSDPSDDFIIFDLNPMGLNLGNGYTLVGVPVVGILGSTYGSVTTFSTQPGTAGMGNISFTIVDDNSGGCTFSETLIDPGTCSNACQLLTTGLTNITCNDNGTPSDATDDYITFDLNPTGNNLGLTYTVSGATLTPTGGNYGTATNFSTTSGTAGAGDLNITITDDNNGTCSIIDIIIDPGTCSGTCNLTASGLNNTQCNDNGTPTDPSDDYITFDLDPSGSNIGTNYTISGTVLTPSGGNYGSVTTYSTEVGTAGAGDLNLTIEDGTTGGCTFGVTIIDPGTCSNTCELTASGISNIICNDNGTPSDNTDDFITFELNPQGSNLGSAYEILGTTTTPLIGNYGIATTFSTLPGTAGTGDLNITIEDVDNGGCTFPEVITDPGTCSNACELIASGLTNVTCNDNGTPSDATDDFITFELDPMGNNLGTSYTVSGAVVTPSGGNYGTSIMYSTAIGTAGAGDLNITITDDVSSTCSLAELIIDPGTCSGSCNITDSGISNIQCNDNGTPSDPSDDFITFDLDPMGGNLGTTYTLIGGTTTPSGGNYGSITSFSTTVGTAGAGDLNLTIVDGATGGCTFGFSVTDPGTCSNACDLLASGLTNVTCNDNGTPSDATDDYITFELNPTGNNLGTTYTVSGAVVTPSGGNYGTSIMYSTAIGTAGAGDLNITITDDASSTCSLAELILDPGTCSGSCNITDSGISNIQCNDNGTPSDPSDDYITFDLDPTGGNLGTTYTLIGGTTTPSGGNYGSITSFSTTVGTAGAGDLNLTIVDGATGGCTFGFSVTDPGTCSNACDLLASGLTNVTCNDNGTPSDATDDYITFELNPTGNNLGASYTISGAVVTPSGGNYGTSIMYSTAIGTAGAGDLNITITDDVSSTCSLAELIIDPGTCSGSCNITDSGISNIQCNDNGTPSDPSDDFITFDLDPMGGNLGTTYTLIGGTTTPSGGNYGSITSFSTTVGTAGAGDLNLTIVDGATGGCTFGFSVTDPGTCSNACDLLASGLTNVTCNDNGTPSDATDDYITFELNPTGNNLGTTYTVSGAVVTPSGGNYGTSIMYSTAIGTAGAGDLNITITDDASSTCSLAELIIDPGTCSGSCNITDSGISNIQCNDNGTPSDPSDDFITFDLDPTGGNLGTTYTLIGGTTTPSGGNYGSITSFSTTVGTAGAGDLNLTIVDGATGGCTFGFSVTDPGTCSNACDLLASGLTNVTCNDNGTPSDATDDYITFELNPTGNNLGTTYTVSGAVVTPSGGNYGTSIMYSTAVGTAGAGDLNITITDDATANCSFPETITDPGTCSGSCNISGSGISNIICNDNGTPTDPSDDFITFDLDPTGGNLGTTYTIIGGTTTPAGGNYGSITSFSTTVGTAGAGDLNLTIVDGSTGGCTFGFSVTDPGTCSNDCELIASGLTNVTCNDNGTPSDATDDFITFELNPTGNNLGASYTISGAVVTPSGGNYGTSIMYSTAVGTAGAGDLNITITDDASSTCSLSELIIDPGTCSGSCNITDSGISNIQCDDNGTPSDPSDDFITFDLDPTGSNLGTNYNIVGAAVTPTGGSYGTATTFSTAAGTAGNGDVSLTIIDATNSGCSIMEMVTDPGSCSANCQMVSTGLTNVTCNDNGTPADATDDFITFDLNPTGNNLGTTYSVSGATLTPNTGNYGSATNFSTAPGTAGSGDLNISITDDSDPNCSLSDVVIDPGTCSGTCNLTASGLTNIQCDDNGTPTDPSDDFITFELDPTGGNLGTNYTLSGAAVTPTGGNYGQVTTYSTTVGTAGMGDLNLSIIDGAAANCTFGVTITDPGSCSSSCELTASGLTNIQCNDNGTPSDATDDYFTFELNPTGSNLGNSYQISGGTITPNLGNYGATTIFSTQPGSAGAGNLNIIITDDSNANCSLSEMVTDPGSCSGSCNLTASGLTNIQCNDNGTPTDSSDDFITFELNPIGSNLGTSYTVSGAAVTPSGGNYGTPITYSTAVGTAGAGDLNITITDAADGNCTIAELISDPGTCSNNCNISDVNISNIQCNDNGTPADPSDDYITFDLNPAGTNLGSNYIIGGGTTTPSVGNYGITTNFSTAAGTAGNGNLNLTLTDGSSANCMTTFAVSDPGTCSNACTLIASGITNVTCNDNGTPSDDTDDFITFELNPTGNNLGTTYNVSGVALTPSIGNYGAITLFSTTVGTAGMGDLNITITDDIDGNCSIVETITDPGSCSGTCNLTAAGLTNIQCNDNGTPSDSSDDYFTFELNPTGNILGAGYSITGAVLTSTNAAYGSPTTFTTVQGSAGAGDLNIVIVDDASNNCTFSTTVTDPGTCSNACDLATSGISNIQCNDNGTPTDATDDFFTFELNPTGSNLGTSYTLSGAAVMPFGGNYGTAITYSTAVGTAGAGDLNITITDDADASCSLLETVTDPGNCSGSCNIFNAGLANIQCNDNGTPTDATDDFFTFELNPTGSNLGTSYTLSGAAVTPSGGNYGTAITYTTASGTAGAGDLNITITDDADANCSLSETVIDPGNCSNNCNISDVGISNIQCNDNGTPSDPSDDFITFDLNPIGINLGTNYSISGGTVTPSTGSYSNSTNFSTAPGTAGSGGDLLLTITDGTSSNCMLPFAVSDPGTCSDDCAMSTSGISNIQCNDNGTPSDNTDDYITFDLNPAGNNLGTSYTLNGAPVTPSGGNYGMAITYSTAVGTAGAGDLNITIADDVDGTCSLAELVTDPGTCSNACVLATSGISNIQCNDNGTPSDPSDDFITFELNPAGTNVGGNYTAGGLGMLTTTGVYGSATVFSTNQGTAGMGDLTITITDGTNPNCTLSETISDPGSCSAECQLVASGLTNIQCNDNGTPIDTSDDYITFDLNPTGNNLGTTYTISGVVTTPMIGNYGSVTSFTTPPGTAGGGDLNITITDDADGNCTLMETVADPGTCKTCPPFAGNITANSGICAGESVDLEFSFSGGTAPYVVKYSDGQTVSDITIAGAGVFSQTVTPNGTTTYTITEITDANDCPGTPGQSITVEVFAEAINTFSDAFCEGDEYELPDGTKVSTPDTYQIVLAGQSINGCDSTITITLTQNPIYDLSESVIVCDSDSYDWNGQTYDSDGTYSVALQSATGCDSMRTLNLTFDGIAIYGTAEAGLDSDECLPETELFGLDVLGTTGNWTSPTGATISPADQGAAFATGLQSGQNTFVWSISTGNCIDFSRDTVEVNVVGSAPILEEDNVFFQNTKPIEIQILENDNLANLGAYTVTCFGLPPEITNCTFNEVSEELNLQVGSETVGVYEFFYSVCSDACPDLCDTTSVQLNLRGERDQTDYIITPENNDGKNDVLIFDNLDDFPDNELIVYNRWGGVVYQAQPYQNDWGGMRKGKRLPEADYYYVIRKELPSEIEFGIVTIKY